MALLVKRFLKIFRNIFLSLIALLILLLVLINLNSVQTYLAQRAANILSDKLKTKVDIRNVRIELLNHVTVEGLYIEDQQKDTLAYIGKAQVRITDWFFMKSTVPVIHYVGLTNAYIHLYRGRNSNKWNYAFIEDAFSSDSPTKKSDTKQEFEIDLEKLLFDNVRFHMDDAWAGYDYDLDFGNFVTNIDDIDFKKKKIIVSNIKLGSSSVRLRDYEGGKPPSPKKATVIDTTAFNPDNWKVNIATVRFNDIHFAFINKETQPYLNEFDPEYIEVKELNTEINDLRIVGDTLRARVDHFNAKERSGFEVKELQSVVSVSPRASICRDLYLKTNNSTVSDYYAMHYDRFPDFNDYIAKVKMVAHLKESKVDARDVAYFAPQLRKLPLGITKFSGEASGTVDDLRSKINVSDGFSTIKGNLAIKGLPDVDVSVFEFMSGEIFTTGNSILRYAPELQRNPNLNLKTLDFVYFKGSFKGLLTDFMAQGQVKTNLGSVIADIKMKIPERQKPTYSGSISSQSFNVGRLFNQTSLGVTTFNAKLEGASFDMSGFHIKAKSTFESFTFNGYTYKNIIADGVFDKNKFDGQLLLDDSNIALGFYGSIDLSQKDIVINATANLLKSDLQALHFSDVPVTLSGDFDLNCSGKSIDDFIGTAKLYNINLQRKTKRMDLDSINIRSYMDANEKHIDIESNLLSAEIKGRFLLSEIPNSMQYYLSRYLPNYIKSTGKVAADQDINFRINTRQVSDLINAFTLSSGFDSSSLVGNLNTINKTLSLKAQVPYGKISTLKIFNTVLVGEGDYNKLNISTNIEHLILSDNLLNTSLKLDARVANDTLTYTLASKSDQQYGTATLSGSAFAKNDTLFAHFLPSELYLNNEKWEILSGNKIVYARNYLLVDQLSFNSGLQKLLVNTDQSRIGQPMVIKATNIDIGQLASLTPAASYNLDGRVNGDILIENLFTQPLVTSNLEAVGVKVLGDTVGLVRIKGSYDMGKSLIVMENSSGIFNDKFSMTTVGNISLDTKSEEQLDGQIFISNFPLKFLEPFLKGYTSSIGGILDGSVSIKGLIEKPNLNGELILRNVAAKVDYTGTLYTIPLGRISLENQTATLNNIELFDVYKNKALATGTVRFANLSNPQMNIRLKTDQFEVVNLRDYENDLFYGHVIAKTDFSINGFISDMNMSINATPTKKSSLYLPYNSAGDYSTNTYISFKSYDVEPTNKITKVKDRLSVKISAVLNSLMDVTLVLDPNTGDQINATGNGNLSINVPANEDYSMFGNYNIEKGSYTFTFRQVLSKTFNINSGSSIAFNGNIANTRLNVFATYPTTGRLYDLLDQNKAQLLSETEIKDAKTTQIVNVQLRMRGTLASPDLSYEIELPEKRSMGTPAFAELNRINTSDKTALTNQVSSLLFLGSFIPSQGITNTLAVTGAKNTLGETIASQASPLLTSALNKLLGDQKLQVMVQYKSFGQEANTTGTGGVVSSADSRNQLKFGLQKNYFDDRLSLQVGSAYDWGRPTTTNQSASSFNLAGDFRAQYLLTSDGGVSLVGFRASNYDLFYGYNIARQGVGLTVRKSFDNLYEFLHSKKRILREKQEKMNGVKP
ncbi:MAG: translocation/assembly module TamB domain-containing protein [Bacteroidota bacterium]